MAPRNQFAVRAVAVLFSVCLLIGAGALWQITLTSPIGVAIGFAACVAFGYTITRLAHVSRARG